MGPRISDQGQGLLLEKEAEEEEDEEEEGGQIRLRRAFTECGRCQVWDNHGRTQNLCVSRCENLITVALLRRNYRGIHFWYL